MERGVTKKGTNQQITMRLLPPDKMLELKAIALRRGLKYQVLIRKTIERMINDSKRDEVREN